MSVKPGTWFLLYFIGAALMIAVGPLDYFMGQMTLLTLAGMLMGFALARMYPPPSQRD